MRITFLAPTANMSGGMRVIAIYARELMRRGHAVRVVSPPCRPVPLRRRLKSLATGGGWPGITRHPASHLDASGVEHCVIDRWRPITDADVPDGDVVIGTWWETAEWVNALRPSKGAKAYFIQGHEVFPYLPTERSRATYRFAMHKIVVARWLKDLMAAQYGDRMADVVPNSVDRSQFFAPERGRQPRATVGLLYSTAPIKGLDAALAAVRLVAPRLPGLSLVAFGSERPVARQPLPPGAAFTHLPQQHKLRELYGQCDAWLTASRSEGFNLPAMEAMACRTPVVATRTGWPEEAVATGHNGVLADVDDVQGLADGLESVLTLPEEQWRTMSANALATVADASWAASATLFERALQRACERAARGEIAGRPCSPLLRPVASRDCNEPALESPGAP
jgi:glycosyltransferase involved in cell wall biosynthesis